MTPQPPVTARDALQQAQQALTEKRRSAARQWATEVARLDPGLEEAWLLLGALGTPAESVAYLERALRINPASSRARAGLEWARQRLQAAGPDSDDITAPLLVSAPERVAAANPEITVEIAAAPPLSDTARLRAAPRRARRSRPVLGWLALVVVLCLAAGGVLALALTGVVLARANSAEHPLSLLKPSLTVTALPAGATATIAPEVARVLTNAPTATSAPSATPAPTEAPPATEPPAPTEAPTPAPTGRPVGPDGVPIVEITPIEPYRPAPGAVTAPQQPYPTAVVYEPQVPVTSGEHWIDVNLSSQTAAAYDGETVVRTFIVSTGTAEHPTVTGQYSVYVKYRYADMAGPGYYLPDVPYVMYFYRGYGLHGTYWHSNFGTPMSHGCVNFSVDDAAWLFDFVSIGTIVNVHY